MVDTKRILLLDRGQLPNTIALSALVALAFYPTYGEISSWIGCGFFMVSFAVLHMANTSRHCLPIPQMAVISASLYYIIGPLLATYFPSEDPLYSFRRSPYLYFEYGVPATIATCCGWLAGLRNLKPMTSATVDAKSFDPIRTTLDGMIVVGTLISMAIVFIQPPKSIAFLLFLVAHLRFVGIMGWVLSVRPGWKARLATVGFIELFSASISGFLLDLILWTAAVVALLLQRFRISRQRVFVLAISGILLLPCIQHAKWKFREIAWTGSSTVRQARVFGFDIAVSRVTKPLILPLMICESFVEVVTFNVESKFFRDTVIRYNQSWIVERVMMSVPARIPYARGETVQRAVIDSIIPRILFPDKMSAGGGELFSRFTGVKLNAQTSMNLGFVGEMYANYGYTYGIVGCGVYGFILGWVFHWLVTRARNNYILIAFVPYVLHWAVLSETGLFEVANYTTKALLVTLVISWYLAKLVRSKNAIRQR